MDNGGGIHHGECPTELLDLEEALSIAHAASFHSRSPAASGGSNLRDLPRQIKQVAAVSVRGHVSEAEAVAAQTPAGVHRDAAAAMTEIRGLVRQELMLEVRAK